MGGIFGTISKKSCVADLFYGTDYNSHLGTRRGGLATFSKEKGFVRSIHNLESSYFRTKFEPSLDKFEGCTSGIGVISDTDAQPLIMNSHLGRFAICTVAKILNIEELTKDLLDKNMHFAEMSSGKTNPTELIALLIIQGKTFKEGIENVYHHIKGSCTMLILTEDGIICARDSWGRTPIIIGKKEGAYAASSESTSFPNLDFEVEYNVGPGEIVKIKADGMEQIRPANKRMQVCSFLWVYYSTWLRPTEWRWTAAAVSPTRAQVWRWGMLPASKCLTSVASPSTLPPGHVRSHLPTRPCARWWPR